MPALGRRDLSGVRQRHAVLYLQLSGQLPRQAGIQNAGLQRCANGCGGGFFVYKLGMDKPDHILIVDDDPEIRALLTDYLVRHGLKATGAADGREMRRVLAREQVDLLVLDLMLPGEDGISLCRELRAPGQPALPIVMLSARSEEADRILGLELGADDYLSKPFAARELLARARSVLRRTRMLPPTLIAEAPLARLQFGPWTLDTVARHLLDERGTVVSLSGAEYRLLRVLLQHPQRILTREQLLQLTQGRDADVFDRSIDLLVSRVRQRLGDGPREARYIKTVRNEGYVFCMAVEALGPL